MPRSLLLVPIAAVIMTTGFAMAQGAPSPEEAAVNARQAHMNLYAFNLTRIGGMAQGNIPYDAAAAQISADNLAQLVSINQEGYWLPGTAAGEIEDSAALPAVWENPEDFEAKFQALKTAVENLQQTAGTDLASLQAGLGGVGQSCGSCHDTYRQQQD